MLSATEMLDHDYLQSRCLLLELAASLDRLDLARGREREDTVGDDPRFERLYASLTLLADREASPDRAERILQLFSDPAE